MKADNCRSKYYFLFKNNFTSYTFLGNNKVYVLANQFLQFPQASDRTDVP